MPWGKAMMQKWQICAQGEQSGRRNHPSAENRAKSQPPQGLMVS
jgi:hypothetical protein